MKTSSRDRGESRWPDLPEELLAEICKLLTWTDSVRLRGICQSWRNSIPSILGNPPRFPLQLPYPMSDYNHSSRRQPPSANLTLTLLQSTTYIFHPNPRRLSDPDSSDSDCWFVTAQERWEPTGLKVRLLNPITQQQLKGFSGKSMDFRDCCCVTEAFRTYTQNEEKVSGIQGKAKRVIIYPEPGSGCAWKEDYLVLAISGNGRLGYLRFGDKNWIPINGDFRYYDDITIYRGKLYVVDQWGLLSMINSSMKPIKVAAPVYEDDRKYLAVSLGDLYLIDMTVKFPKVIEIRVYKLNEEEHDWDRVKSIGDRMLFVGVEGAFFLSAHILRGGLKGNCIYFALESRKIVTLIREGPEDLDVQRIGVFNLEDGSITDLTSFPGYSKIFWPPPPWIRLD
uniref:KIB1-4 beta-propeller domain-containing protein n=1 Tax=Rhizophora mucronata TaxID=61149 RepID=A0A2P2J892_RHIMU